MFTSRGTWLRLFLLAPVVGVSGLASAEVVHRKDGTKLVGTLQGAGSILTLDGTTVFDRSDVESIEDAKSLKRRIDELSTEAVDSVRWNAIARFAAEKGMFDAAFDAADQACAAQPNTEVPRILDDLPLAGTLRADALTPQRVKTWLSIAADASSPSRAIVARTRLHGKLSQAREGVAKPLLAAIANALAERSPAMRREALRVIGVIRSSELANCVGEHLLRDVDPSVRRAALDAAVALKNAGDQRVLPPILKGLEGGPKARAAALEALEGLLDVHAVGSLVRALASSGATSGVENSMSVTRQVAYVKDFDVEVANSSTIADPIIGVLQDGVTLDVTLYGVSERGWSSSERARIGALLERLTSERYGTNADKWNAWLAAKSKTI